MAYIETNGPIIQKKKRDWILVANLLLALFTASLTFYNLGLVGESNKLNRETLQLQNSLFNFSSAIIPVEKYNEYTLFNSSMSRETLDQSFPVGLYGYVQKDLKVVTPHYGYLSVDFKNFTFSENAHMATLERRNDYEISYVGAQKYEDIVVQGSNQITVSLQLRISVYLNLNDLSSDIRGMQFPLGDLTLEATLLDLQTNQTMTKEFNVSVVASIKITDS
jgi:hypothetical protein